MKANQVTAERQSETATNEPHYLRVCGDLIADGPTLQRVERYYTLGGITTAGNALVRIYASATKRGNRQERNCVVVLSTSEARQLGQALLEAADANQAARDAERASTEGA